MIKKLLLAASLSIAAPAMALGECDDFDTNLAYKACLGERFAVVDAELNRIWPLAIAEIDAADWMESERRAEWRGALVQAQRDWIAYKDRDCTEVVAFEWGGGSGTGGAISQCLIDATASRGRALMDRYRIDPAVAPVIIALTSE